MPLTRNSKGRFVRKISRNSRAVARRAKSNPRRRRATLRANPVRRRSAARRVMRANPRHRRHARHFRHNPAVLGMMLPSWEAMLYTGVGILTPALVEEQVNKFVPDAWKTGTTGTLVSWLVKAVSAFGPGMLVRKYASKDAGNYMLIAGGAVFGMGIIKTVFPGVVPGLGAQPLLGQYPGMGAYFNRATPAGARFQRSRANVPTMLSTAPERLNPANRF